MSQRRILLCFEKEFHVAMHMFIFQDVMLHFDGICYALHDAMICNARLCKMLMHGQAFGYTVW